MQRFFPCCRSVDWGCAFLIALGASASCYGAAPPSQLDQEYFPATRQFEANIGKNGAHSQTFTVGAGGKLTSVELLLRKNAVVTMPLLFDIRTTTLGDPTLPDAGTNVLASLTIDAVNIPTEERSTIRQLPLPTAFDLTSFDIGVTPGQVLAIVIRSDDPGVPYNGSAYSWLGEASDRYGRGKGSSRYLQSGWRTLNGSYDLSFRSFVSIPEPAAMILVSMGFLGLMACRRR